MNSLPAISDCSRERLIQLFQFLKELNNHRNPTPRQIKDQLKLRWLDALPDHPNIHLSRLVHGDQTNAAEDAGGALLRVARPHLTKAPEPPAVIRPWVLPGWNDWKEDDVRVQKTRNEHDEEGETITVRFDEEPERVAELSAWRKLRSDWRINEIPARKTMQLFDWLHGLHGEIQRQGEQVELMLGTGILSWQQTAGAVNYPLLSQRVQLHFDPQVPEFTLVDADAPTELNLVLLQQLEGIEANVLIQIRDLVSGSFCHPLAEEASSTLNQIPAMLAANGKFVGEQRPAPAPDAPEVGKVPVLFLRKHAQGMSSAIDQVLTAISRRTHFPRALLNVAGVTPQMPDTDGDGVDDGGNETLDERGDTTRRRNPVVNRGGLDALFAKESNPEQTRIAQRLNQHDCVLVQGPPGTGKSHTIANLIGHLLAQGQTVLVTSHKAKALKVLRNQLPEDLQPLCVSVLDDDAESQEQLERAVHGISERLDTDDPDSLDSEARRLTKQREALLEQLSDLHGQMLQARRAEYQEICSGGESFSPVTAARWVSEHAERDAWIPGPVSLGATLPLTPTEVSELYASNSKTSEEDDRLADITLPSVEVLPTPDEIAQLVDQLTTLTQRPPCTAADVATTLQPPIAAIDQLSQVTRSLEQALKRYAQFAPWQLCLVDAGRKGDGEREPWEHLIGKIHEFDRVLSASRMSTLLQPVVADDIPIPEQYNRVCEIVGHLESGGKLTFANRLFNSRWRQVLARWTVGGNRPSDPEHFLAIKQTLEVRLANDELELLWDSLMARAGVPSSADLSEDLSGNALQYVNSITEALDWWQQSWEPMEQQLRAWGWERAALLARVEPIHEQFGSLKRHIHAANTLLLDALKEKSAELQSAELERQIQELAAKLARHPHPEIQELAQSISARSPSAYKEQYERVRSASDRQQLVKRRQELLRKLEYRDRQGGMIAERWAAQIKSRQGIHGGDAVPGDVLSAWKWRQLNDELQKRGELDVHAIGDQITQINQQVRETTIRLIDRLAWSRQARRIKPAQRQTLTGWLDTVRRIGRGYGKRVSELRRAARSQMKNCHSAVPVWIMPITRLAENFDLSQTSVDVVIVDEASQCDVMGLILFSVAKQIVVVGDHEQVSPSAVGQDLATVSNLIRTHLDGIPNAHLYEGRLSIYDLARQSFGGQIRLVEHFRCVPDIIAFSNRISYHGEIKPLRETASGSFKKSLIEHHVKPASVTNKVNYVEAETIAALMVAASEQPEYDGKSMGAICLLGEDQAREIEKLLRIHMAPERIEKHRIVCGNPPHFQGDERDVVFLSLVDVSHGNPLRVRNNQSFKQRFNVAASRARDQMWVVHSLDTADLAAEDLRRRLIEHARNPNALENATQRLASQTGSEFEQDVLRSLMDAGYRVHPQWEVGRYRIDLVVQGSARRLAIECDGDRYHGIDELPNDMARQAVLERLGWTFFRIRGSEYYRDRQAVLDRLFRKLEEMDIAPLGTVHEPTEGQKESPDELIQRVRARADQLIAEWNLPEDEQLEMEQLETEQDESGHRNFFGSDGDAFLYSREPTFTLVHEDGAGTSQSPAVEPSNKESAEEEGVSQPLGAPDEDSDEDAGLPLFQDLFEAQTSDEEDDADLDADEWFRLSRWAKERDLLTSWDRRFAYTQGLRVSRGDAPTDKQWKICTRIIKEATELGFEPTSDI